MYKRESDCNILLGNTENMFNDLGNCFETAFDEKKTKMNVIGSIFSLGKSITKLTFNVGVCAVKNAPKAIVAVAAVKREVISAVEEGIQEHNKKQQEDALDEKIKQLSFKSGALNERQHI